MNNLVYLKDRISKYQDLMVLNETLGLDIQYNEVLEYIYYIEQLYPNLKIDDEEIQLQYTLANTILEEYLEFYNFYFERLEKDTYIQNKNNISLLAEIKEFILHFELFIQILNDNKELVNSLKEELINYYNKLSIIILNNKEKDKTFLKDLNNFINKAFKELNYDFNSFSIIYLKYLNTIIKKQREKHED